MDTVILSFTISSVEIVAKTICTHPGSFALKLIDPEFQAVLVTPHIPYFARPVRRYFESDNTITEYGMYQAQNMAIALYAGYNEVQKHSTALEEKADEITKPIYLIKLEIEDELNKLNSVRRGWKAKFLSHVITEKIYTAEKKAIEENKRKLKSEYEQYKRTTIQTTLDVVLPELSTHAHSCGCYTATDAIRNYYLKLVDQKLDLFLQFQKTKVGV